MILKRFALLLATLITILVTLPCSNYQSYAAADYGDDIEIKQSLEQDLATFNFDYTRYCLDESEYIHPVLITFKESKREDSLDLIYFFTREPLYNDTSENGISLLAMHSNVYCGDNLDTIDDAYLQDWRIELLDVDSLETENGGYIHRLAISDLHGANFYNEHLKGHRELFKYRIYEFYKLEYYISINGKRTWYTLELDNSFAFDDSLRLIYSNCINVILEDVHCWSWHFDEDEGWWENLWDSWWNRDTLTDQLFYSFYVENWDVSELKSIDLRYKKALLKGYRHNEADQGTEKEFYQGTTGTDYDPKFYAWNDNNSKDIYDTSIYLGNSIQSAFDAVGYTYDTIVADEINTANTADGKYKWNKIQNIVDFKRNFANHTELVNFASGYFNEPTEKYWIINFDEFYYKFSQTRAIYSQYFVNYLAGVPVYQNRQILDYNSDFFDYLLDYGYSLDDLEKWVDPTVTTGSVGYDGLMCYQFYQEYIFDMTATQMTFEDSGNNTYTLPVSVAPVNEEGSGGTMIRPDEDIDFGRILAIILGILIFIILWPLIVPIFTLLINIITIPFKWIGGIFSRKKK